MDATQLVRLIPFLRTSSVAPFAVTSATRTSRSGGGGAMAEVYGECRGRIVEGPVRVRLVSSPRIRVHLFPLKSTAETYTRPSQDPRRLIRRHSRPPSPISCQSSLTSSAHQSPHIIINCVQAPPHSCIAGLNMGAILQYIEKMQTRSATCCCRGMGYRFAQVEEG